MSDWWNKYADAPPTNAPVAGGSVWDKYPEAPKRAAGAASVLANDNPDQSAKVLKWEKETKVPASVIEADVPGFERDLKAKTAREAVERNRYISDFIDRDPRNASIANGDYANLEAVTKSLSDVRYGVSDSLFPEPVKKLATAAGEAVGRVGAAVAEGFGKEPLGISAENLAKLPGEYAMVWNPLVAQPLDAALRGVRALVYGNAQVFGEYVRATTGSDAEAARATRDAITMLDMAMIAGGNPMSPPSLNRLAARARTLTSSPEEIQAFIAEAQTGTARGSAWRSEIDDFLRTKEGAEVKQTLQIEYAGNNAKVLDKAVETAQSSALRTRAPERFEELARAVTDDNVYLPAEKIIEIYEKAGKVPAVGDGLFGYIPDLANRLRMAQAAGTEIEVSVGAYIAHTDPSVHKEVRDVARLRHDSMTVEEAKAAGENVIEIGPPIETGAVTSEEGVKFAQAAAAEVEASGLRPLFDPVTKPEAAAAEVKANPLKPEAAPSTPKIESEAVRLMFQKPPSSMTQPEFDRYAKLVENQHKELLDRAIEAARKEVSKRQTPEWKANAERTRVEVETDLRSDPAVAADRFMHTGVLPTGETLTPPKLNIEDVNRLAPGHGIKDLTAKDGIDPDIVAASLGFDTGADLIMALDRMQYERKAGGLSRQAQFKQMVDRETALRMEERHGNLQEAIAEEALDIALSRTQVNILAAEMEILAKEAGIIPSMRRGEIEKAVRAEFEKKPADEARRYERFQQGVFREGRAAEKALLKGDFEEAFKAKQRQMIALVQAAEAKDFAKVVKQVEKSVVRMSNRENKSVDPVYLNQIRALLDRIGVQQKYPHPSNMGLEQFVADTQGSLAVADWLYDTGKRIDEFNVEEMRDFEKSLKSLIHVGRAEKKVNSARAAAELDNVVMDIVKELDRFKTVHQGINASAPQRLKSLGRQVVAQHLLVERMLDYTDKFNPHGPITEFLDRPLRDAYTKELELTERATKALRDLGKFTDSSVNDKIPNKLIKDPLDRTGYLNMTRSTLRNLMLNMGNEGNLTKLAQGYGVKVEDLWAMVDQYATKKDWQYVQGMWDIYKWVKEEADAMQLRVTGVPADTVVSVPVKNKHGDWAGGYWPIRYSRPPAEKINPADPLYQGLYRQATTPQAYTKRRTDYVGEIDLSDNFIASQLRAQIHDIAFREAVNNGRKLLRRPDLMLAFEQKWSKEFSSLLPGWLRDIANSQNFDDLEARGMVRAMSLARQNVISVLTWMNPTTTIKHGGGAALMSVRQVGAVPLLKAAKAIGVKGTAKTAVNLIKPDRSTTEADMDFIQAFQDVLATGENGDEVRKFIEMSSAVMRNRNNTIRDSIWGAEQMASNAGVGYWLSSLRQHTQHVGRMPIAFFDGLSANATWYAAYKRAFMSGEDHASSVFIANKEVSRAHGSNFIGDVPAISRQPNTVAGEVVRSFTGLYRWWNHQANNDFQMAWDAKAALEGNKRKEPWATPWALSLGVAGVVAMIVWEHGAHPPLDKSERWESPAAEWAAAAGRFYGSKFIVLRDFTNFALAGYEPSTGPFGYVAAEVEKMVKDANRAQRRQLIHGLTLLSIATGIGGVPLWRALSFQKDKLEGKERPRTLKEEIQGYWTGQSRPRVFR